MQLKVESSTKKQQSGNASNKDTMQAKQRKWLNSRIQIKKLIYRLKSRKKKKKEKCERV